MIRRCGRRRSAGLMMFLLSGLGKGREGRGLGYEFMKLGARGPGRAEWSVWADAE